MYMYGCVSVSDGTRMVVLTSDGLMFDHVSYISDVITFVHVRSKASARPCVSDGVAMHVIVEGDIFDFF